MGCGASLAAPPTIAESPPTKDTPSPKADGSRQLRRLERRSCTPDKATLRRKSLAVLAGTGLQEAEAEALVNAMSIAELVHTNARVGVHRRSSVASGKVAGRLRRVSVAAPAGLSEPEAEALTLVLTNEQLATAVTRAGLSVEDLTSDDGSELRRRASVALQHPLSALPLSAADDQASELRARRNSLELLANAVLDDRPFDEAMLWQASMSDLSEMSSGGGLYAAANTVGGGEPAVAAAPDDDEEETATGDDAAHTTAWSPEVRSIPAVLLPAAAFA